MQPGTHSVIEISPTELIADPSGFGTLIDVREPNEHAAGTIPGAHLIPIGQLVERISSVAAPDEPVVLYCAVGARSAAGAEALIGLGYREVRNLVGGYNSWAFHKQHPGMNGLTPTQRDRYARHLVLEGFGEKGQLSLLQRSVLIVGAGGLGSPAALYLAAAGVGRIGIVDGDTVEVSNLQRQIVHNVDRVGRPKAMSAAETIDRINPEIDIRVFETRIDAANAISIAGEYDVILDATDSFQTRYLLTDLSLVTHIPVVHGSIFRFEGQVSVFAPGRGPCYRCLFPEPPPPELAPNCSTAGVLGVLPGIVGSIQATEVIKLLSGIGKPLIGRLLVYDALEVSAMTLRVARRPDCEACGDDATVSLVDYDVSCRRP